MSRSRALAHVDLRSGRRLLPWLSLLLVSASLAHAINSAVSSPRASRHGQRKRSGSHPSLLCCLHLRRQVGP